MAYLWRIAAGLWCISGEIVVGCGKFVANRGKFVAIRANRRRLGGEMERQNYPSKKREARVTIVTTPLPSRKNQGSKTAKSDRIASNCGTPRACSNEDNGGKTVEKSLQPMAGEGLESCRERQAKRYEKPLPKSETDPFIRAENEDDDGYDPYSDRPARSDFFEPNPWD